MMLRLSLCVLLICSVHAKQNIYDFLNDNNCQSFASLLQGTGYASLVGNDHKGPYTVYAPTDTAFENLPPEIKPIFFYGNFELTLAIASYHITDGIHLIASLQNNALIDTMLENNQLRFNRYHTIQTISGANISRPDLMATNGIVHIIDRVLYHLPEVQTPQYISENVNLTTMALLMDKAGMHDALKEFMDRYMANSVYFTSDLTNGQDLFSLSKSRISISVTAGNITVNGSGVYRPDLITKNGVVHIIDKLF